MGGCLHTGRMLLVAMPVQGSLTRVVIGTCRARRCGGAHAATLPPPAPHPASLYAVSGPGAYGGLHAPAEDDTGMRPGSGTSGQQPGPAGSAGAARAPQEQLGKSPYLQQQYGSAAEAGMAGGKTTAVAGGDSEAQLVADPKPQANQLTPIDDDA